MKYTLLTKEQFEELNEEFARFLASQEIDKTEWNEIKANRPEVARKEMEIFSDVVWDKALEQAKYIDHIGTKSINLFFKENLDFYRVAIRVNRAGFDLENPEDYKWLMANLDDAQVEIFTGKKSLDENWKEEIFDLIQKGSVLSNGDLYKALTPYF
ncbi:MAG: DUF6495 family protein [Flavobacteriaceae bacterium]